MKLEIVEIKYGRKWNTGDYSSETLEAVAAVPEEESPYEHLKALMAFVNSKGEIQPTTIEEKTPEIKKEEPKPEQTEVEKIQEEVVVEEKPKTAKGRPKKVAQEKEAPEKIEKAPIKKAPVYDKYDRASEVHKKVVGDLLDKNFPNWRKNINKAKNASLAMEGKDFLDSEGIVIPEFLEALKVAMA